MPHELSSVEMMVLIFCLCVLWLALKGQKSIHDRALEQKAERLAERFHNTYERLAPDFGYKTRESSAVKWSDVPEDNKKLMIATCKELLNE